MKEIEEIAKAIAIHTPDPCVILLVGLPGSGKSSLTKAFIAEHKDTISVCRDDFRSALNGGVYVYGKDKHPEFESIVAHTATMSAMISLDEGLNVIIDETHIRAEKRIAVVQRFSGWPVICVWCKESERNLEFRSTNLRGYDASTWENIINSMKADFQPPTMAEGYVAIIEHEIPHA